ncbi:MAG: class I SAM-dependent methyltransferase [Cellulosilyticum sp.]|nr:class I SAM-dependent methyltransferase [Cellulosilyticum sp.]
MDVGKEKIMRSFDELARAYDTSKSSRFASQCHSYVLNILNPMQFNNILDVGCGTGSLMGKLLDTKPQIKGYGLDLSEKMLEVAREKLPERTELVYGEAEVLPYDNKKFDMVVMVDSFNYFVNPEQAIQEAYRVLRPGGTLVMAEKMITGFKKYFVDGNNYTEEEIRKFLKQAGFDVINLIRNIPGGYIATGDKREI